MTDQMTEATREQFFDAITSRGLDVHPEIVSRFPYTSIWRFIRMPGKPIYGKTVDRLERGRIRTSYFLKTNV